MTTDFGATPAPPPSSAKTNTLAIVAVVCGAIGIVMSFCCGLFGIPLDIAAIICGGIALSQIKRTFEQGRGMAIGGIVMGVLGIILAIVMVVLGVAIQGMPQFQQFQQGMPGQEVIIEDELGPAEGGSELEPVEPAEPGEVVPEPAE